LLLSYLKFHNSIFSQFESSSHAKFLRDRRRSMDSLVWGSAGNMTAADDSDNDDLALSAEVQHSAGLHSPSRQALPSLQLRRWQKLGTVFGITLGLRAIAETRRSASDPEIETARLDSDFRLRSPPLSPQDGATPPFSPRTLRARSPTSVSMYSLDSKRSSLTGLQAHRRVRKFSETQSDYVLEADASLAAEMAAANLALVPQLHVSAPRLSNTDDDDELVEDTVYLDD
jgi:hypothetical protein